MTACAHRWLTAAGERRDSCGECGVFATEVLADLAERLAAAEEARDQLSAALSVVNAQKAAAEAARRLVVQQYEQRVREYNEEWRKNQADLQRVTEEREHLEMCATTWAETCRKVEDDLQRVRGALKTAIQQMRQHDDDQDCGRGFFDTIGMIEAALTGPATKP